MAQHSTVIEELANYKGLIFDFDETLVDLGVNWEALKKELSNYYKEKAGIDLPFAPLDRTLQNIRERHGYDIYTDLLQIITKHELKGANYRLNETLITYINTHKNQQIAIYSMNTFITIKNFITKHIHVKPDIIISKEFVTQPKPTDKDLLLIMTS